MAGGRPTPQPLAVLATVIATLVVAASGVPATAQTETVRAVVTDEQGRPVPDVEVELRETGGGSIVERATTDREGQFEVTAAEVRPGREFALHLAGFEDVVLPITPQHLVVSRIEFTMKRTMIVDAEPAAAPEPREPTPTRYVPMSEERERAIRLYNAAVEQYEKATKNKSEADKREAEKKLREAASVDPSFAEPHRLLARIAMKSQNWAEASRYAEDLLRIEPDDTEAIRILYLSLVILRHHYRVGDAAVLLAKADPEAIASIEEHARTYYGNGLYLMARALYEALTQVSDDPETAYLNVGICCVALDDPEGARSAFETFLKLAPEDHPDIPMVREQLESLP